MQSPVFSLYESAYCFDSSDPAASAVNLIPTEWNRFTVTDGKFFTDETLEALKWRDVYLAKTIEEVSGELENKYIAGEGIEIDKENRTISRTDTKYKLTCGSGLVYNENLNRSINVILDGSNENNLWINYNGELATKIPDTEPGEEGVTVNSFIVTLDKSDPSSISTFPPNAGVVYVNSAECYVCEEKRYGNPNKRIENDWTSTEPFDPREIEYGETISDYTASSYKEYFYTGIVPGIEPTSDVVSGLVTVSSYPESPEHIEFDPTDRRTIFWDSTTASGGKNYITEDEAEFPVDMCPSGILYIW